MVWEKLMEWFKNNEQQNLYELLNSNIPTLTADNCLLLIADSDVEKGIIQTGMGLIIGFLKRNFSDFNEIVLELTKEKKSKKIILNQKDKYYLLVKKNPLLDKFRLELDLELEM